MPNTGGPMGPLPAPTDPQSDECHEASERRYAECIAAGMTPRKAGIEASIAGARQRRVQLGLEPDAPDPYYVPPEQRLRFDKHGRRILPKKAR